MRDMLRAAEMDRAARDAYEAERAAREAFNAEQAARTSFGRKSFPKEGTLSLAQPHVRPTASSAP
jgi:hypothetical protein